MEPEIGPCLKRRFLVEIIVFRCHVRFSRCICMMGVDRKWSNKAGYSPKWLNGLVACEDNHSNKDSQIQALVQVLVLQVHILTGEILQGILEWQQHWKSRGHLIVLDNFVVFKNWIMQMPSGFGWNSQTVLKHFRKVSIGLNGTMESIQCEDMLITYIELLYCVHLNIIHRM